MRSSEVSPSGIVSNDRSLLTGEPADRTTLATPVTTRGSVVGPSTAEYHERMHNVNEPLKEQRVTQTPTEVLSDLVDPATVNLQEMNKNPKEPETRVHEGISSNKSMNSNKESSGLNFSNF